MGHRDAEKIPAPQGLSEMDADLTRLHYLSNQLSSLQRLPESKLRDSMKASLTALLSDPSKCLTTVLTVESLRGMEKQLVEAKADKENLIILQNDCDRLEKDVGRLTYQLTESRRGRILITLILGVIGGILLKSYVLLG